jgi:16S rRNA (cytidine1402-2'-O)-methyltransferase
MVLAREVTKKFEEILRGSPSELLAKLHGRSIKGEFTVVIEGRKGAAVPAGEKSL